MIYSLQQKHRVQTLEELIALTEEYRGKLSDITSYDERIAELTERKEEQYKQVKQQAEVLTKARAAVFLLQGIDHVQTVVHLIQPCRIELDRLTLRRD